EDSKKEAVPQAKAVGPRKGLQTASGGRKLPDQEGEIRGLTPPARRERKRGQDLCFSGSCPQFLRKLTCPLRFLTGWDRTWPAAGTRSRPSSPAAAWPRSTGRATATWKPRSSSRSPCPS